MKNVLEDCKDKLTPWQLCKYKMRMFGTFWINEKDDIYFFNVSTTLLIQNSQRNYKIPVQSLSSPHKGESYIFKTLCNMEHLMW